MIKVIIDPNCLLRILPKNSEYRCLWDAFVHGKFELGYTTEMLQEYEEVLLRFYSAAFTRFAIDTFSTHPMQSK